MMDDIVKLPPRTCGRGSGAASIVFYSPEITNVDPLIAQKIEGLPRGMSMHCGGLVITPSPIQHYAPVEKLIDGYPLLVMCWTY
jgi:DNA polymerase III alpha subunit